MFYQNDVYVATEYGTRECQEDREPCGAFYGIPFSGEVEDQAEYDRQQIYDYLPDRHFSPKDEIILAHMRGEIELPDWYFQDKEPERKPQTFVQKEDEKREVKLINEFVLNTQAPPDIVAEYRVYVRKYVKGEWQLLNKLLDMYERWMTNKKITARLCGIRV